MRSILPHWFITIPCLDDDFIFSIHNINSPLYSTTVLTLHIVVMVIGIQVGSRTIMDSFRQFYPDFILRGDLLKKLVMSVGLEKNTRLCWFWLVAWSTFKLSWCAQNMLSSFAFDYSLYKFKVSSTHHVLALVTDWPFSNELPAYCRYLKRIDKQEPITNRVKQRIFCLNWLKKIFVFALHFLLFM